MPCTTWPRPGCRAVIPASNGWSRRPRRSPSGCWTWSSRRTWRTPPVWKWKEISTHPIRSWDDFRDFFLMVLEKWYGYGSIPIHTVFRGWTSIYQLFWGSLGTRVLIHPHIMSYNVPAFVVIVIFLICSSIVGYFFHDFWMGWISIPPFFSWCRHEGLTARLEWPVGNIRFQWLSPLRLV